MMKESNRHSLDALYLVEQLSLKIQDKSDELSLGFTNVSNPLAETLKCISLTLTGLHELGDKMIDIDDDIDLNKDLDTEWVKNEIKEEESQEIKVEDVPDITVKEEAKDNLDDKNSILGKRTKISDKVSPKPKKAKNGVKYKCVECEYVGVRPNLVKNHMKSTHLIEEITYIVDSQDPNKKYYVCSYGLDCKSLVTSKKKMESHVMKKHKNVLTAEEENYSDSVAVKEYQCIRCDYKTKKKVYFDDHTSGGLKYWPCLWCEDHIPLKQRGRFTDHLTIKHNVIVEDKKLKCTYCYKLLDNTRKFLFHIGKVHGIGTQHHCNQCDYSSLGIKNYKFHMGMHDTSSVPCHICGFIAENKTRLSKHVYLRHKEGYCELCNKSFKDKVSLYTHKHNIHGTREGQEGKIVCDQCGKECASKGKLTIHLKNFHGSEKQCDKCEYKTSIESKFIYHMESRHGEAKYSCNKCDYRCTTSSKLVLHKQVKHKNMSASCDICGQNFKRKYSLKAHMNLKHSASAPRYKCTQPSCSYSTNAPWILKTHVAKVHEGVRWPCELCNYVGGYKGDLSKHKKIVHDGFILECSQCEFKTPKNSTLKEHLKQHHGKDSVDIKGED